MTHRDVVLADGATLEGAVVGSDGRPLAGVSVAATGQAHAEWDRKAFSGPDGRFTIPHLPPGETVGCHAWLVGTSSRFAETQTCRAADGSLRIVFPVGGLLRLRFVGADPGPRVAERAYLVGSHYGRWIPFRFRDAVTEVALSKEGVSTDTTRRVREALMLELRGGEPTIERIAKKLAVTPRTLQRRLQDEGSSFQGVLDAVRADLAQRYLTDNRLGVSEVAFLLGYADASAFARAFRRWYGKAPAESRRPGLAS